MPSYLVCADTSRITTAVPLKISDFCPGVDYFMEQNRTATFLPMNVSSCHSSTLGQFTANQGVVYGMCEGSTYFCLLHVKVKQDMYVSAHVELQKAFWCGYGEREIWKMYMYLRDTDSISERLNCQYTLQDMFFQSAADSMWIKIIKKPVAAISIRAVKQHDLFLERTSEYSGYVTVPDVHHNVPYSMELILLSESAIMISVLQSYQLGTCDPKRKVQVAYRKYNTSPELGACVCIERSTPASLFLASSIRIYFIHDRSKLSFLKMAFSVFPVIGHPYKLPSGLFNCSVINYFKFHHFLRCNLKTECEDGRDETGHCPFSSPECQGMVASTNKCYKLVVVDNLLNNEQFSLECQKFGLRMATVKSRKETEESLWILGNYVNFDLDLGYTSGWYSVPFMYSQFRKWSDNTIIYNMNHFRYSYAITVIVSRIKKQGSWTNEGLSERVSWQANYGAICELKLQQLGAFSLQVVRTQSESNLSTFSQTEQSVTVCSDSHVIHTFMYCDADSYCGNPYSSEGFVLLNASASQNKISSSSEINNICAFGMFGCNDDVTSLHFTLVCDLWQDCPDNSDESFCVHPSCKDFWCSNGQCVLHSQRCNEYSDCVDDTDEVNCPQQYWTTSCTYCIQFKDVRTKQRFLFNLDGTGYFIHKMMGNAEYCPDTHFRCTSEGLYCLPIYTRCNGFSDCINGEDEQNCHEVRCSGLFRCRASKSCLHRDHLCDGWGQCPQRDDELMCDMTCPEGCVCQGHSFLCRNTFAVDLFPQLRYIDATGSGMSLNEFNTSIDIIHLSLGHCYISNVSGMQFPNLQYMDLASNHLQYLDMSNFLGLLNLKTLRVADNPIRPNTVNKFTKLIHYSLKQIDVSKVNLHTVASEVSTFLPMLDHLNLSFSAIKIIGSLGFKNMPLLREVDIRFNPLESFPLDLLTGSGHLQNVFSSNYRLCCENLLPRVSGKIKCSAPHATVSSCVQLMPTDLYRVFFWMVSACSTLGNLLCLISLFAHKGFEKDFSMTANLLFAQSCMGYYISIVVVANEVFGDRYIQCEKMWISSLPCKMAEFIFYLSSEASVFIIGVITMNHTIVVCFSKEPYMFKTVSRTPAFILPWCVAMLISLTPFVTGLPQGELQGQSGLCGMALFNQYTFHQEFRWSNVVVTINFVTYLAIAAGQFVICRHTPKFRIMFDSSSSSVSSAVPLVRKVATTNSASWILLGLVLTLTTNGIPALYITHDAIVVFGLPLSAALSPFIYLWTLVMQRRQKALEAKVLKMLKSRLVASEKQAIKQNVKTIN